MTKSSKPSQEPAPAQAGFQVDSNVIWGVAMLALGYTGAFADSSFALYLVGGGMLAWGVFRTLVPPAPQAQSKKGRPASPAGDGLRETVESLVVAFILAFLFKSFEAEAFVIPTGSMAPTLLGRHKDVDCEQCGYHYTVGASQELDNGRLITPGRLRTSRCPNCRFDNDVFELSPFPGDRIIVTKLYEEPQRFDVIVFKYPEEPHVNYIKRCVGLPNETISIMQGDLYRRVQEGDEWEILRKPDADKQQAIQMLVYDDRYFPRNLVASGWPVRWASVVPSTDPNAIGGWSEHGAGFQHDQANHSYAVSAPETGHEWLRYRHIVAGAADWQAALNNEPIQPVSRLISDFCGYNMFSPQRGVDDHGPYWVGDLTVEFNVEIKQTTSASELVVELVEGFNTYRVRINPTTGKASITRTWESTESEIATADTPILGAGSYDIRFANVDSRLNLWVNGRVIELGEGTLIRTGSGSETPTDKDLCPVGIGAKGMDLKVADLVIYRDIYYRDETYRDEDSRGMVTETWNEVAREAAMSSLLSTPDDWHRAYSDGRRERDFDLSRMVTYELGPTDYLMFGDNSPKSQDSRLFPQGARKARRDEFKRYAVPADAIIGKAFFVYWPHGQPFMNEGKGYPFPLSYHVDQDGRQVKEYPNHRFPFYPNVQRMRRIR